MLEVKQTSLRRCVITSNAKPNLLVEHALSLSVVSPHSMSVSIENDQIFCVESNLDVA